MAVISTRHLLLAFSVRIPYNTERPYPALAALEVRTADASLSFSRSSMRILSFNVPISSACSLYAKSLSRRISINIWHTPSEVKGKSGRLDTAIAGLERPFSSPGFSIVPCPRRTQDGLKLNCSHNKAIVSVPAFILPFRISVNLDGFISKLCAIPAFDSPLSFKRLSIACRNLLLISTLSIIFVF